jgi:hypothetical protein
MPRSTPTVARRTRRADFDSVYGDGDTVRAAAVRSSAPPPPRRRRRRARRAERDVAGITDAQSLALLHAGDPERKRFQRQGTRDGGHRTPRTTQVRRGQIPDRRPGWHYSATDFAQSLIDSFRFNRRNSRAHGMLFYRLLQQAVATDPHPLTDSTKGNCTQRYAKRTCVCVTAKFSASSRQVG